MKCPSCGSNKNQVLEIRQRCDSAVRRRECLDCKDRFTTVEHYRDNIAKHEKSRLHKIRKEQHKKRVTPVAVAVDHNGDYVDPTLQDFDDEERDILDNFRRSMEWT